MCLPFCHKYKLEDKKQVDVYDADYPTSRGPAYCLYLYFYVCEKCGLHKLKKFKT